MRHQKAEPGLGGLPVPGPSRPAQRAPAPSRPGPGRGPGSERGFTLLELMVALMLLGVGVLGVAQVFAVSNRHVSHAREETTAICLAQEIREKIMSESFEDIPSIFDGTDTDDPGTVHLPAEAWAEHLADELGPFGRGTIEVVTPDSDASLPNGLVSITVTISWREGSGEISLPLRFCVAKTTP